MKKNLPLIAGAVVIILLLVGGGVFAYTKLTKSEAGEEKTAQATPKPARKKRADAPNTIPVAERPYVTISPKDSRNIILTVHEVNKSATDLEFELDYQTGEMSQGAFGELELGSLPVTKEILLGSCSAGGACTYHENVKGGGLLLKFSGSQDYSLEQKWNYLEGIATKKLESKDEKFLIDSKELSRNRQIIIYNTPGTPKGLDGTPVSGAYSITTNGSMKGTGKVTIELDEAASDATVMGWTGSTWKELPTEVDGKSATAQGDVMEVYVAVKK